ncbi:hypothetical protein Py04_1489 [Pyrococcus sp. ST04]|nr:hypothetical protein Py04_1489 [Pyrococcus sp. ST04]
MKIRLAYPDAVVVISDDSVLMFKGKLIEASLEEVLSYAESGSGIIPDELKEIALDILRAVESIRRIGEIKERAVGALAY